MNLNFNWLQKHIAITFVHAAPFYIKLTEVQHISNISTTCIPFYTIFYRRNQLIFLVKGIKKYMLIPEN